MICDKIRLMVACKVSRVKALLSQVMVLDQLGVYELRVVMKRFRDALQSHRDRLNQLNVYPVPDGDTGTNMSLTLETVVAEIAAREDDMGAVCDAISHGSLMGARGNSGVILSQILRALAGAIKAAGYVDAQVLAAALKQASKAADEGGIGAGRGHYFDGG